MSGSKWSKMFFRNTLVAHKSLINPYFSGVAVQQALIRRFRNIQFKKIFSLSGFQSWEVFYGLFYSALREKTCIFRIRLL